MQPLLRRIGKIALIIAAVPLVFFFVLVPILALTVDLSGTVRKQLVAATPQIEEQLGRKLRFGEVRLKLVPSIAAEIRDVAIEAAPEQSGIAAQPLLELGAARVGIAVWPLVSSLGREVQISYIEAQGLKLTAVRFPDGRLSYEDVLEKLQQQPKEPKKPLTPEQVSYLRRLSISRVALTGMAVRFYDLSDPGAAATPISIEQVDLVATDVRLTRPFPITLDAAVLSAQRNLHLMVTVGPFPEDLDVQQPLALLRQLELNVRPVLLGPVLRFVPAEGVSLDNALLSANLLITLPAEAGQLHIKGDMDLKGLVLGVGVGKGRQVGRPADVGLRADVMFSPLAGDLKAQTLEVTLDDMGISGTADVRDLWRSPAVHALALSSRGLLLERLLAILPPPSLPRGSILRGPLSLHASGSGSPTEAQVEMGLDLTPATILLPMLHKPAAMPLTAEFRGKLNGGGMDIERLGVVLGPLSLLLHGRTSAKDGLDLLLDSGRVELDRMLRLLPDVQKNVPPGGRLAGELQVRGEIKQKGEDTTASAQISMTGADARAPGLELVGTAGLSAQVHSTPASASLHGDLDLTGARVYVPGSMDKGAGVPMHLKLSLDRTGKMVLLREADLQLPGGLVQLRGQADLGGHRLDMNVPLCDLDLSRLSAVLPALKHAGGLAGGHLRFSLSLDGDPQRLATVRAQLLSLGLDAAGGHLQGTAEVVGLDEPRKISFDFSGEGIDLDRLSGPESQQKTEAAPQPGRPMTVPPMLRHLELDGRLRLASGRLRGQPLRNLELAVSGQGGKLMMKTLQAQALGGTITAGGTSLDVSQAVPRFALRAKMDHVDIGEVMSLRPGSGPPPMEGHGSASLEVDGTGLSWAEIAPRLSGQLGLNMTDGRLHAPSVKATVVNPLLAAAQAHGKAKFAPPTEMLLKDLAVHFAIHNSQLTTTTPLKLNTEEGSLSLSGSIGLDQSLALYGDVELSPKALEAASGGQLAPERPVPVSLRISGALKAPRIEVLDLGRTLAALAGAALRGKAKTLLQGFGAPQPGAPAQAPDVQKRLLDEAQKRLQQQQPFKPGEALQNLFGH